MSFYGDAVGKELSLRPCFTQAAETPLQEFRGHDRWVPSWHSERVNSIRRSIFWVMEEPDSPAAGDRFALISHICGCSILAVILVNLVAFVLETLPAFEPTEDVAAFKVIEVSTTIMFTLEYLVRLWVCDVFGSSMVTWMLKPMNLCDLLAIAPMYAEFFLNSQNAYDIKGLRVLRVIRLFKVGRYSQGVRVMTAALTNSFSALYILVFLFFVGNILCASAIYFTEKLSCPFFEAGGERGLAEFALFNAECASSTDNLSPTYGPCCRYQCRDIPANMSSYLCEFEWMDSAGITIGSFEKPVPLWEAMAMHDAEFTSVVTGMWWACVTMTTVGYGDYVPKHWSSKLVGSVAMVAGLLIIAMPFAIIGAKFGEAVAKIELPETEEVPVLDRLETFETRAEDISNAADAVPVTTAVFSDLQANIKQAIHLKREMIKLQALRDNLWTSVEHSFAELAYEGILSFGDDMLVEPKQSSIKQGEDDDDGFCERSLGLFHRDLWLRRLAISLTTAWWFDRAVVVLILLNSVILAMHDYYPRNTEPWQNVLDDRTDPFFIAAFTVECVLKVVAQGLVLHHNAYLRDAWNWLDFVVVVFGLLTLSIQSGSSIPWLRTIRVLRSLRTLSAMEGMRSLVNTIFLSLPRLKDVVIMACFLLATFGILGLHFWGGVMHRLCRVTTEPLHFSPRAADPSYDCKGWCFDNVSTITLNLGHGLGVRSISSAPLFEAFCRGRQQAEGDSSEVHPSACEAAFSEGRDYWLWPVDQSQERLCGNYKCRPADPSEWEFGLGTSQLVAEVLVPLGISQAANGQVPTVCGNAFSSDTLYGPEAVNAVLKGVDLDDWSDEVFSDTFNWGITRYDQLGSAILVIFQCITLEGWVDIMYMLEDAFSPSFFSFIYFLLLVLLGSFFLLNVTLAIVWDAFQSIQEKEAYEEEANGRSGRITVAMQQAIKQNPAALLLGQGNYDDLRDTRFSKQSRSYKVLKSFLFDVVGRDLMSLTALRLRTKKRAPGEVIAEWHPWYIVRLARQIASGAFFNSLVMAMIMANVLVLALDMYRDPLVPIDVSDKLNLTFNVIFVCEFVLLHVALGPSCYWSDKALAFDGVIVLVSVVEIIIESFGSGAGSGITAVRAFRLLRIFKLAKRFPSMKGLLRAVVETLMQMYNFVFLLFLIIVVFALVGQSFFGGKFLFDSSGRLIKTEDMATRCPFGDGGKPNCVPRAHFDTFLWGVLTIFQILTGENWNTVMYDGMKAAGWPFLLYFVAVVVFGNFVILNLFLAILMMNFEEARDKIKEEERKKAEVKRRVKREREAALARLSAGSDAEAAVQAIIHDESYGKSASHLSHTRTFYNNATGHMAKVWKERAHVTGVLRPFLTKAFTHMPSVGEERSDWPEARQTEPPAEIRGATEDLKVESVDGVVSEDADGADSPATAATTPARKTVKVVETVESRDSISEGASPLSGAASPRRRPSEVDSLDPRRVNSAGKLFLQTLQVNHPNYTEGRKPRDTGISFRSLSNLSRLYDEGMWDRSLFIFSENLALRQFCLRISKHPKFDQTIIALIMLSSGLMMFQSPLYDPNSLKERILSNVGLVFSGIFTLEMVIKVLARGLLFSSPRGRHQAYLRSPWNIMDAIIVVVSDVDAVLSLVANEDSGVLEQLKIFRMARMMRPLRLISRNENLKIVVRTISASLPELRNLVLFSSIFFLIFGLLGVSLFKGSFYSCQTSDLEPHPFAESPDATSLCIPPLQAADPAVMRFASQATASCTAGAEAWQRPTRDTPICEVHCTGSDNAFCTSSSPWGYHIMRCSDCQQAFCPEPDKSRDECSSYCTDHHFFCTDHQGSAECMEQCISECLCEDHCNGLADDAALCVEQGGRWINMNQNFDNIIFGWVSLFEISTTEGWVDLMYAGIDSRGPMKQPKRDSQEILGALVFVSFILVGAFFVLNLCVGVIINNYHAQLMARGHLFITHAQAKWIAWQKALYMKRHFFPQTNLHLLSPTRQHLVRIVTSSWFDTLIMTCIILNTVVLGLAWHPTPSTVYTDTLETCNFLFAMVFNVEAAMKLGAMHLGYFYESWNVFDFSCVLVSDVVLILEAFNDTLVEFGSVVNTVRIFRIARLFRLVRFLKGLNQLCFAFILSVPKLLNVALIMCLLIFLYAVLGVNLFAKVGYLGTGMHGDHANFHTFFDAFPVLLRSMTGEAWNEIMHDLSKSRFYYESYLDIRCQANMKVTKANFHELDLDGDGVVDSPNQCGTPLAFLYFITYTLSVTFVVLNLFIAVILDGFDESQNSEVSDIIQTCIDRWKKYDESCAMVIPLDRALDYVDEVVDVLCRRGEKQAMPWYSMSRWDSQYRGDVQEGQYAWAHYNLEYMRMLNLRVVGAPEFQVRFVVVVKAILRRLICQGGLNPEVGLTSKEMRRNLLEVEALEQLTVTDDRELRSELEKLRAMDRRQSAALTAIALPSHFFDDSCRTEGRWLSFEERTLREEVAAAKIQRGAKVLLQKRRGQAAASAAKHSPGGQLLPRAAGC